MRWIKLWVDEWLSGTTRFDLSLAERAIWIDLLALAGRSRIPGIVASGQEADGTIRGYPWIWLAGNIICDEGILRAALARFEASGKIKISTQKREGVEEISIEILSWEKYQSEYQRTLKYRIDTKNKSVKNKYTKSTPQNQKKYALEVEGEGEVEGEVEEDKKKIQTKNGSTPDGVLPKDASRNSNNSKKRTTNGEDKIIQIFREQYEWINGVVYELHNLEKMREQARRVSGYTGKFSRSIAMALHRHWATLYLLENDASLEQNKLILANNHSFGPYTTSLRRWALEAKEVPLIQKPDDIRQLRSVLSKHPKVEAQIKILSGKAPEMKQACARVLADILKKERERRRAS